MKVDVTFFYFLFRDTNNFQPQGHRDDYVNRDAIREAQRDREREQMPEYRDYVNQVPLRDKESESNTAQRRHRPG
jgi:hypothetical protein